MTNEGVDVLSVYHFFFKSRTYDTVDQPFQLSHPFTPSAAK